MSVKIIQDRLSTYNCKSEIDEMHALREITQELVLAALGRTDFFKVAGFQGGTCLRIFFGLPVVYIAKNRDQFPAFGFGT